MFNPLLHTHALHTLVLTVLGNRLSYSQTTTKNQAVQGMNFTRRQVIAAGAGAGALLGTGVFGSAAADTTTLVTKPIPGTNEQLPVIGIGTNRWAAGGSPAEIQGLRDTLQGFRELGGRVIDTAPAYRTSEKVLGQLISELGFDDAFFLATKVDREEKMDGIRRMEDSLTKLNRSTMDLMQVHNLRGAETQLKTMLEWRDAGRIRYVGITTSRNDQHAEMAALMKSMPLDFIQVNYSLADRAAEDVILPLAEARGMAVLVNLPLARGRLFKATADAELPGWAAEFDCRSWGQFFLKYVVSHSGVTCAIPGMTRLAHARDNLGAAYGRLPDAAMRARQEKLLASL